ncbi:alpha/beta hydrolase [Clostridium tertium]|jgi:acetyl esterase/lipase|uniref:alpha/beta hydrolase n=1 Tax=Clostridium TaxID=1485 RepID=UPI000BE4026C|nr:MULTISPECIES: alpha/beta hydrolase [Clostridium]MBS5305599.1 alpha/beta hydrolase [Clostridium sp.]MDB1923726.1 alpha/beta hydrolase [Clostridium tertium]MDB1925960.1 alpha/beta hydrolase [Clostridium tertium]MDB1929250.1 alpha/beta hydrolase [Clostridium tertium]MDB1932789.1 alpha/beta hydrolase [Clostridium tertium]
MIYEKIGLKDIASKLKESNAVISVYIPENSEEININKKRETIIMCPGGGYVMTSDREAEPVALKFMAEGFNVVVLRYSVAPNKFPKALIELAATVNYARSKSEEWNVDKDKIIVCGFSAGGHLAGSLGVLWDNKILEEALEMNKDNIKPNAMMLCYPVITSGEFAHKGSFDNLLDENISEVEREKLSLEKLVSKETPQTFLWHTFDDGAVPVQNSLFFANSLASNNVPFELHIYPNGVHGLSLCEELTAMNGQSEHINQHAGTWFKLAVEWIKNL